MTSKPSRPGDSPVDASRPLVPIAAAFATGILLDHWLLIPTSAWIIVLLGCLFAGIALRGRVTIATLALHVALVAAGGGWTSMAAMVGTHDIGRLATDERRLCRLQGIVAGDVVTVLPDPDDEAFVATSEPRTHWTLDVERMETADGWRTASGLANVSVTGIVENASAGDRVVILGWLSRPRRPMNPGEFDYREYLAQQGISASLFTETPSAVEQLPGPTLPSLNTLRDRVRNHFSRQLHDQLPSRSARIAEAFLLGVRTALPPEELLPFVESGTVHVLVVSGLHVSLLAGIVWVTLTAFGVNLPRRALITIVAIAAYTFLTGGNPPAVRAAVLTGLLFGGYLLHRDHNPMNSLAGSALVVLVLSPTDLFRPGPQLSFLCAFALLAVAPPLFVRPPEEPRENRWVRALSWTWRWFANLVVVSVVLWLVTAPLVMFYFHLWSPIGIAASLPLVVGSGATLFLGVVFFAIGWIPYVGGLVAIPLNGLLLLMERTSAMAAKAEPLCQYLPGPPDWWIVGFYAILIAPWFLPTPRRLDRTHLILLLSWLVIGTAGELLPSHPSDTEYTQLAVGHGLAGVLRCSSGHTMLLDCGSIRGPKIADRVIAPFLWNEGVRRIDAVVISHADIDHFNGLLRLARRFAIGEILAPPQFAKSKEPAVAIVLEELQRRQIPIRFISQGDSIRVGEARIDVLHPPADYQGQTDNAESLVLRIVVDERSILCTGDLADDGLAAMIAEPIEPVDVFIAPHHGSKASNDERTSQWVHPDVVISSQDQPRGRGDTLDVYAGARILRTDQFGAITIQWTNDGLAVHPFLNPTESIAP